MKIEFYDWSVSMGEHWKLEFHRKKRYNWNKLLKKILEIDDEGEKIKLYRRNDNTNIYIFEYIDRIIGMRVRFIPLIKESKRHTDGKVYYTQRHQLTDKEKEAVVKEIKKEIKNGVLRLELPSIDVQIEEKNDYLKEIELRDFRILDFFSHLPVIFAFDFGDTLTIILETDYKKAKKKASANDNDLDFIVFGTGKKIDVYVGE